MKGYVPGGINLELVALTGSIVVWWGMIEGILAHDIIAMNVVPSVSADKECWPLQIATKRLIAQWARARRLTHEAWPHAKFDLEATVADLRNCAMVRHRLIHSFWGYGSPTQKRDDFVIRTMKPSRDTAGALEFERYLIAPETLDQFNTRLSHLYTRIAAAAADLGFGFLGHVAMTIRPKDAPPIVLDDRRPPPKSILER